MGVLPACGVATDTPGHDHTSSSQGTPVLGNSTLDQAGIAKITADRAATLDLSSGRLSRSAAGLAEGMQSPMVDLAGKGMMRLTIKAPHGTIEAQTDVLRALIFEGQSDVDTLTYFLTAETKEDFLTLARSGTAYGIDGGAIETWAKSVGDAPTGRHYFVLPAGESTGLRVVYDLRFDADKKVQVIIVTVNPLT